MQKYYNKSMFWRQISHKNIKICGFYNYEEKRI